MGKKQKACIISSLVFISASGFAQDSAADTSLIPMTAVFHNMDRNLLGSFVYNYGLNVATALMELYPDNAAVKIGSLTYASLIGLGVSTNIHWFSDAVAGALIGYAIGSVVGNSYRKLLSRDQHEQSYNLYLTPTGITLTCRF